MNFGLREFHQLNEDTKLSNMLKHSLQQQESYGEYRKTLLHFHTPASHDYKLIITPKNRKYMTFSENEIIKIAEERNLFVYNKLNIDYLRTMAAKNNNFVDLSELISYLLIADKIYRKKIELAIITDHNSISGFIKLKNAMSILKKFLADDAVIPVIQPGIEISCGDSLHVVGIFDEKVEVRDKIQEFLSKNLVSSSEGSFLPSWKVIDEIKNIGGVGYVAHFNSSNVFKPEFGYSGAYKKMLFTLDNMQVVGLSDLKKMRYIDSKLKTDRKLAIDAITYLLDEDSHELDSLANKTFWLKGQKIDFNMIVNALHDSDISIRYDDPSLPETYVKSITVFGNGFLGKKDQVFDVSFSTALNCIIGGRGSGKSTLLDSISLVLSQRIRNIDQLKNVCRQGPIVLRVIYNEQDYFIYFNPVIDEVEDDAFVRGYLFGSEHQYEYSERKEKNPNLIELQNKTIDKIQIFTVKDEKIFEISKKHDFLKSIFKSSYSINELVKFATDDKITNFIFEQLNIKNGTVKKVKRVTISDDETLSNKYSTIGSILKRRMTNINQVIEKFNHSTNNIQLTYKQLQLNDIEFNWAPHLNPSFYNKIKFLKNFNISASDILSYLDFLTEKENPIAVYLLFSKKRWNEINEIKSIISYATDFGTYEIQNGINRIDENNKNKVLELIANSIVKPSKFEIYNFLNVYYQQVDIFDLQFDINSYEHSGKDERIYKSIKQVSLGQKVVSLLDFIFSFSEISDDQTPLLLDQPEDNLDSSYIYQHLVRSLRREKDKRQVIIVTHNSTIVTNAKPEEVISLRSDNSHGWVESFGYPNEENVIKSIVNLLEGGVESFNHKAFIYRKVLND